MSLVLPHVQPEQCHLSCMGRLVQTGPYLVSTLRAVFSRSKGLSVIADRSEWLCALAPIVLAMSSYWRSFPLRTSSSVLWSLRHPLVARHCKCQHRYLHQRRVEYPLPSYQRTFAPQQCNVTPRAATIAAQLSWTSHLCRLRRPVHARCKPPRAGHKVHL